MAYRLVAELDTEWAGVVVATEQTRWGSHVCLQQQPMARWSLVHCRPSAAAALVPEPAHPVLIRDAPMLLASAALVMFAVTSEQLGLTCLLARQVRTC